MIRYVIIFCAFFLISYNVGAQRTSTFPSPTGFVNDFEDDFTADQEKTLNAAVKELLYKTMQRDSLRGIEMAIVTVTDVMYGDEKEMSSYATRLGDKWGVSSRGENRAIIIAYGKKIRKVCIVTGSALDNVLPPAVCNRIVEEKMAPAFKNGDYYNAILEAIKNISSALGL